MNMEENQLQNNQPESNQLLHLEQVQPGGVDPTGNYGPSVDEQNLRKFVKIGLVIVVSVFSLIVLDGFFGEKELPHTQQPIVHQPQHFQPVQPLPTINNEEHHETDNSIDTQQAEDSVDVKSLQHTDPLTQQLERQQKSTEEIYEKPPTRASPQSSHHFDPPKEEKPAQQPQKEQNEGWQWPEQKQIWSTQIFSHLKNKQASSQHPTYLHAQTTQHQSYQTLYPQPHIYTYHKATFHSKPPILKINPEQVQTLITSIKQSSNNLPWQANFAYQLHNHPTSSLHQQAQYYLYDTMYSIGQYDEKPMCLIAAGRDIIKKNYQYKEFFNSIIRQNYTNFHLVLGDDASDDCTLDVMRSIVALTPSLADRTTIIQHEQNMGALGNKDIMIRNHCQKGDIIVDIDSDDSLIGCQVLKTINAMYQQSDSWFIYANFIFWHQKIKIGYSMAITDEIWQQNNYRSSSLWVTTHLRTYLRELYMKIPLEYFMEYPGYYYLWASDRFIMYALTEMAGKQHTSYLPLFLYYYNRTAANRSKCDWSPIQYYQWKARIHTPFAPLASLNDKVKQMEKFQLSEEAALKYEEKKKKYKSCQVGQEQ